MFEASPFADRCDEYTRWVENISINQAKEFTLRRACSTFNPLEDILYEIVKRQGISSMKKENSIEITPSQYLKENPHVEIDERKIMNRFILDIMGEILM